MPDTSPPPPPPPTAGHPAPAPIPAPPVGSVAVVTAADEPTILDKLWALVRDNLLPGVEPPKKKVLDPLGLRINKGRGWNNVQILAAASIFGVALPSIYYATMYNRLPRGFLVASIIAAVFSFFWLVFEWRRIDPEKIRRPKPEAIARRVKWLMGAFFASATVTFLAFAQWLTTSQPVGILVIAVGFFLVSGLHSWLRYERRRLRVTWTTPVAVKFTAFGFFHTALTFMLGMLALQTGMNLLIGIFGVMLTLILVSGILTSANFRRLSVRRDLPDEIYAADAVRVRLVLANGKNFLPTYSMWVQEAWPEGVPEPEILPSAYALRVPPGGEVPVDYTIEFPTRGAYRFMGFSCMTRFPFTLFSRYRYFSDAHDVLVFPRPRPLPDHLRPRVNATHMSASQAMPHGRGDGDFRGLRAYVAGEDPLNAIHWATTARVGRPMVRELDRETAAPRWVIVEPDWEGARFEAAIDLAASFIHDAFASRIPFTLAILPEQPIGPPSHEAAHRRACFERLAKLTGFKANNPEPRTLVALREMAANARVWPMAGGSAVVAIVTANQRAFHDTVARIVPRGCPLTLVRADA